MTFKKIISFLFLLFILIIICTTNVYAARATQVTTFSDSSQSADALTFLASFQSSEIVPDDFTPSQIELDTASTKLGNKYIGIVQAIGSIASVGALVVIGIKYMLGSAEEKAEYKSTMIPYIIGCILVFMASTIVGAIYTSIHS